MYKNLIFNAIKKLTVLVILFSSNVKAESCDIDAALLKADYSIETAHVDEQHQTDKNDKLTFELVRSNNQVAHYYPNKNITDTWIKYPNKKIALTRYFESQQRAIEYQPTELKNKVNWLQKNQIIAPQQIEEMTLVTTAGTGCYQQSEYHFTKGEVNVRLTWLPQLSLVKRLQITQGTHRKVWQLNDVESSANYVNKFFDKRYHYQSTDYADIGDNESDPFLVKMINLGFVEHSPKGFYNSNGDNISPAHNHRH